MPPNPEFFTAAAQILPVLALTAVLEGRLLIRETEETGQEEGADPDHETSSVMWFWLMATISATGVGEAVALWSILETPSWRGAAIIVWAIGISLGAMTWGFSFNLLSSMPASFAQRTSVSVITGVLFAAVLFFGAAFIVIFASVFYGFELWNR